MSTSLDRAQLRRALSQYSGVVTVKTAQVTPVESGFSGAGVWRVDDAGRSFALRRWPEGAIEPARLTELHRWLGHLRDAGLPVAVPTKSDALSTWLESDGRVWQLEPWLPGDPELAAEPSSARVAAAAQALAQLHRASASYRGTPHGEAWFRVTSGPSPAVGERLVVLDGVAVGAPLLDGVRSRQISSAFAALAGRGWEQVRRWRPTMERELATARTISVPLFPCLRDARPDHFLFTGDEVSGIIDAAATRTESPAADLSRLLGGYLGNRVERWPAALAAYESIRPLAAGERQLVPILDRSNAVLSTWTWIQRIAVGMFSNTDCKAAARLAQLVERLEALA